MSEELQEQTGVENGDAGQVSGETGVEESVMPTDEAGEPQVEQTTEQEPSAVELALRKARDDNARKARETEEQNAYLRGQLEQLTTQQQPQDPYEGRDPDEPVTYEDLLRFKEDNRKAMEQERMLLTQQQQKDRIDRSITKAKATHKDFDEILEYANQVFSKEEMGAIGQTEDPGEMLCQMVKARPEIQAQQVSTQKAEAVKQTVEAINERMNAPGTLSDVGGSDRLLDQVKKWDQMNPNSPEFAAEVERVKRL